MKRTAGQLVMSQSTLCSYTQSAKQKYRMYKSLLEQDAILQIHHWVDQTCLVHCAFHGDAKLARSYQLSASKILITISIDRFKLTRASSTVNSSNLILYQIFPLYGTLRGGPTCSHEPHVLYRSGVLKGDKMEPCIIQQLKSNLNQWYSQPHYFRPNIITYSVTSHMSQYCLNVCTWIEACSANGRKTSSL